MILRFLTIMIVAASLLTSTGLAAAPGNGNGNGAPKLQMFGKSHPFFVGDLPRGRMREKIESLPAHARQRALDWMHRFDFPSEDLDSMVVDEEGAVFYVDPAPVICEGPQCPEQIEAVAETGQASTGLANPPSSTLSADDAFVLHSRPGSPNTVFLDFDGHTFTGTAWGSGTYSGEAFDLDGNPSSFNPTERAAIAEIWHRVAEDFASFDIDVTTEEPPVFGPYTGHVLITSRTQTNGSAMPYDTAGGVAYVNVWGRSNYASYYSPALVYYDNLGSAATYTAEASAHEFGHNLGLSHDGTSTTAYYAGHGSGATSWAPIMGASYYNNVTQWSRGEYTDANNTQDDLAVLAAALFLAADEHGDTRGTATALSIDGNGEIVVSDPEIDPHNTYTENKGVIDSADDWDYFTFSAGTGTVDFRINPSWQAYYRDNRRGANLDVRAVLLDADGNILAESDPTTDTYASISTTVGAGTHYLAITGVGNSYYSGYASQGQYFVSGSVVSEPNTPPAADFSFACQTLACSFVDGSTDDNGSIVAWSWDFGNGASAATQSPDHSYASAGTYTVTLTVTDNDGATDTVSKSVSITTGDTNIELIVDNQDSNIDKTGTWKISSGTDPWAGQSVFNDSGSAFRWLPAIPESGRYAVYAWWTYHVNRSSTVPYRIGHDAGVATVTVDQHNPALGGRWVLLGEYDFAAGAGYVEVSSENGQASADAVRLVKSGGGSNPPPTDTQAPAVSIASPAANANVSGSVTVQVNATDDTAVARVELYADGQLLTVDQTAPYEYVWDSTQHDDGDVTLTARAFDAAGNENADGNVVAVNNAETEIELIMDNQDPNTEKTGTWKTSSGTDPWAGQSVFNNSDSVFRWLPAIPQSGRYKVYAWWTYHVNRSSTVPYRIGHDAGVATVTVDQHNPALAGRWVLLGEYDFAAGAGYVEVSSENGQASADAVRLTKAP